MFINTLEACFYLCLLSATVLSLSYWRLPPTEPIFKALACRVLISRTITTPVPGYIALNHNSSLRHRYWEQYNHHNLWSETLQPNTWFILFQHAKFINSNLLQLFLNLPFFSIISRTCLRKKLSISYVTNNFVMILSCV